MDNLAADFEINPNNPLNAEYDLSEGVGFDCSFELYASGTVWGNIDGDINNQTDLINLLNTKVNLTSFEELSQTVTNNYNELTGDIADLTTTVTDNYNTLSGQISDLTGVVNDNYTSLDNRLTTVEGSILDLTDTVNDNYTELNGKITTTNNNLSTLSQIVQDNNTAINNRVDGIVDSFDGDISDLNDAIDNLSDTVSDNYTDLNDKITDNTDDITTIQNTINSYGDIVSYDAANFATANQGALADTALQPNDNISELVNDVGYITSASLPTVNNATITIQKNGSSVGTFTLNQANNDTLNITVPTQASDIGAMPDTTTIEDLTTTAQLNALNSGATTSNIGQITTNQNNIADIRDLIPLQASTSNQLADKGFVNSSIATNTANFIGTFNSVAELEAYSGTLTNNDYAFVATTDSAGNTLYDRYKYNADTQEWLFEYELNNSSFTAQQWASINSGITSGDVTLIETALQPNDNITELVNNAGYITSADLPTNNVTTNTAQTISANKTFTGVTRFQNGSGNGCMILGADVSNTTVSNNVRKLGRMSFHTYENTVDCAFVSTDSQNSGDVNTNYVEFGGRTGDVANTSPDVLRFTLAKVHNSTATADKLYGLVMSYSDGANFGVQPKYNNVNLATESFVTSQGYITSSDLTNYVTTNTAQNITGLKTFKNQVVFQTGSYQGGLVLGADAGTTTLTADTRKVARIVSRTQDLTTNCAILNFDSIDNVNRLNVGGASGESVNTVPDAIDFTIANVHNSKTDKSTIFSINKTMANFSVQPKYNNVNLATETYVDTGLATKQATLISGTNIKTVNDTSLLGSGNIEISEIFIAEYNVTSYSDISTAYNKGKTIYCKYTVSSFQSNYIPLAQFTGIEFVFCGTVSDDETLLTTCNQINIWHDKRSDKVTSISSSSTDMQYPSAKCVYDELENKADTDLSNVSSIDSNSAVQTALDGKVDLDYSNADYQPVNKAGDTMTGGLGITSADTRIDQNNTDITKGANPSSAKYWGIMFNASSGDTWQSKRLGRIEETIDTNGNTSLSMGTYQNEADSTNQSVLQLYMSQSGVASCTFPNTTCCDGQWNYINTRLMNSVSLNGTTNLTYTLTNIPADGHNYEVLLTGNCTVSATANNVAYLYVSSDKISSEMQLCRFNTRTNTSHTISGSVILPVSNSRKIYVFRGSDNNGTASLWLRGYRRIGTNA